MPHKQWQRISCSAAQVDRNHQGQLTQDAGKKWYAASWHFTDSIGCCWRLWLWWNKRPITKSGACDISYPENAIFQATKTLKTIEERHFASAGETEKCVELHGDGSNWQNQYTNFSSAHHTVKLFGRQWNEIEEIERNCKGLTGPVKKECWLRYWILAVFPEREKISENEKLFCYVQTRDWCTPN